MTSVDIAPAPGGYDAAVLTVRGDVDLYTAPLLRQAGLSVIDAGQPHLIIDLAGMPFIDSTGLGVLVGLLKPARASGGHVTVAGANASVASILRVTSLHDAFRAAPTVTHVLRACYLDPAPRPDAADSRQVPRPGSATAPRAAAWCPADDYPAGSPRMPLSAPVWVGPPRR